MRTRTSLLFYLLWFIHCDQHLLYFLHCVLTLLQIIIRPVCSEALLDRFISTSGRLHRELDARGHGHSAKYTEGWTWLQRGSKMSLILRRSSKHHKVNITGFAASVPSEISST